VLIATGLGVGLLPAMPGTWASLAALPVGWIVRSWFGVAGLAAAGAILFVAGWWASARATAGDHAADPGADPGAIVIDEIAAQLVALLLCPLDWRWYAAGFVLFRLFDIAKPWPIGWLDRSVKGGFGIMLDDVAAASYVLALLALGQGVFGVRP
jgi:phosphatidylglycerophosphatase A